MTEPIITIFDRKFTLHRDTYIDGKNIFLELLDEEGETYLVLTCNIPGAHLEEGEFTVKSWTENEPFITSIFASGLFIDTGRRIASGFVQVPVWRFADPVPAPPIPDQYRLTEIPEHVLHAAPTTDRNPLPASIVKWSGSSPIPLIGSQVVVRLNGLGPGTVTGYFVRAGWLGVTVRLENAPEWWLRQTKQASSQLIDASDAGVFGAELL